MSPKLSPFPSLFAAVLGLALGTPSVVSAAPKERAPAPPPPVAKSELAAAGPDWVKICFDDAQTRKELCYTTRDFAEDGAPILSLEAFDAKGEDQKLLRFLTPLGLALKPGFRVAVDKGKPESGGFDVCFPAGCYASARVPVAFFEAMKRAEKLLLVAKKLSGEEMTFVLPLAGFGRVSGGPGLDPKAAEEQHTKLQEELQRKAEEEKKKQEAQKSAEPAPPAPGAPVAAPPVSPPASPPAPALQPAEPAK
jgi:invasion protein IalB